MAQPNPQPAAKSDQTIWIYLSLILGWVFSLIGLAVVKDDDRVRFHCAQTGVLSVAFCVVSFVLNIIPILGQILWFLLWLGYIVYIILLIVKVSKGENPRIPVCADFAEKNLMNLFK